MVRGSIPSSVPLSHDQVLAAVESLYLDEVKPFGWILRLRCSELVSSMAVSLNVNLLQLRKVCESCGRLRVESEDGGKWSVVIRGRSANFVDFYDPVNPFSSSFWIEALKCINDVPDWDVNSQSGRYNLAQSLLERSPECLRGFSLGQACHIVQLAMSEKKLLRLQNERPISLTSHLQRSRWSDDSPSEDEHMSPTACIDACAHFSSKHESHEEVSLVESSASLRSTVNLSHVVKNTFIHVAHESLVKVGSHRRSQSVPKDVGSPRSAEFAYSDPVFFPGHHVETEVELKHHSDSWCDSMASTADSTSTFSDPPTPATTSLVACAVTDDAPDQRSSFTSAFVSEEAPQSQRMKLRATGQALMMRLAEKTEPPQSSWPELVTTWDDMTNNWLFQNCQGDYLQLESQWGPVAHGGWPVDGNWWDVSSGSCYQTRRLRSNRRLRANDGQM